ncbi:hypothetical protein, partial [Streptomyces sp. NPDC005877]|uniref:hypothetical protein n=1 Tax=Streptomyces sp. NPDC005877 TaxID=3155346 RepID=UPI0033F14F89
DRRARVAACAQGTAHRVDAYRGEHEEHRTEPRHDRVLVAAGEMHEAYAENGPEHDEQRLADPVREETEEETEHLVISP